MTTPNQVAPTGTYDKMPSIPLPPGAEIVGSPLVWTTIADAAARREPSNGGVVIVDTYPGVDKPALIGQIAAALPAHLVLDVENEAALSISDIDLMIQRNLTDDRVFGVMSHATVDAFYDDERLNTLATSIDRSSGAIVVVGWGADLVARKLVTRGEPVTVLVDMSRWELQLRQRAGAPNWRCDNVGEDNLRKYKRGFFVEWRMADRHKRTLFDRIDFVLDGNPLVSADSRVGSITGEVFRDAMLAATSAPFRVVPFFDPGVWGGQWMKERLELDPSQPNYAWCFDCVPEENSLLLERDGDVVEVPAMDLVLTQPERLLGERTFARFGAEFPIRFDFLDTMGGGNLSLQVHPLTDYMQQTFGMAYTQDESYYMLDVEDDAVVYLGVKEGVDPSAMREELRAAARGDRPFDTERFINAIPAKKHDHFSIPAGTVHCSGANAMVLEISATPFIFTFKLWDWGRLGLDGVPRPVHLDHGEANIQWSRDTGWVDEHLLGRVREVDRTDDVVEERTGLHELEFIEVRRHWFESAVAHDTDGTVNVLNLVEGDVVDVVSPTDAFAPFPVHYAETFIVPAAVGPYTIRRSERSTSARFATVKAYVRGTRSSDE